MATRKDTSADNKSLTHVRSDQINRAVDRIMKNRAKIVMSMRDIIVDLMFLKNNAADFKRTRGLTVEEFIKLELGFSKASFYQHIKAYQVCIEYEKPDLYEKVSNYKVLLEVAKIKDKKEQKKAFRKVEKDPDISVFEIDELFPVHQVNSSPGPSADFMTELNDDTISTGKRAITGYYENKYLRDNKTLKIDSGIIDYLINTYEHIAQAFETNSPGENEKAISKTYRDVARDLKDIVKFAGKK